MAFPDPLVIKDAADVSQSYSRRLPIPNGNRYVRVDSTSPLTDSCDIRTLYTPKKGGKDAYHRHIITFTRTRVDADDMAHAASLSMSLVRSIATDVTDADIDELFAAMADFLETSSGDYKTRFERGEV